MLKGVVVKRHDTCLTYVLKRVGLWDKFPIYESFNLKKYFRVIPILKNTSLKKGTIVVWSNNFTSQEINCEITSKGIIKQKTIKFKYHFGVVESSSTVSDLTRKDNYLYPRIRVRELVDDGKSRAETFVRIPDFYLEIK